MSKSETIAIASASFERDLAIKAIRKLVKGETGLEVRRMDNFSLVAVTALHRLLNQQPESGELALCYNPKSRVGLYSAAQYFSVDLVQGMLASIVAGEEMRPVDFISTVGNTANYYMAKLFALDGPNIFIGSSDDAPQKLEMLAQCDFEDNLIDFAISIHWRETEHSVQCEAKLAKLARNSANYS